MSDRGSFFSMPSSSIYLDRRSVPQSIFTSPESTPFSGSRGNSAIGTRRASPGKRETLKSMDSKSPDHEGDTQFYAVSPDGDTNTTSLLDSPCTLASGVDTPAKKSKVSESPDKKSKMPFMMMMLQNRLQYLPVATAIFITASFFISYGIAVYNKSVEPFFPYISYTAVKAPERCVFAQLVNFGAFLLAANMYVRFKQMNQVMKLLEREVGRARTVNKVALGLGLVSCIGLTIVANFQVRLSAVNEFPPLVNVTHSPVLSQSEKRIETIVMRPGHYTGAGLAFVFGTVYCWMQTWLSAKMCERRWTAPALLQLVNSAMLTICLLSFTISKLYYRFNERGRDSEYTRWGKLRAAYLSSTIFEWLTAFCIVSFALTFYKDFSRVKLKSPTVEIVDPDNVRKDYNCHQVTRDSEAPPTENGGAHNTRDHVV